MKRKKSLVVFAACLATVATLAGCGKVGGSASAPASSGATSTIQPKDMTMFTVVKLMGNPWFNRMGEGVTAFAKSSGVNATTTGGNDATPEKQISVIQSLIAQKPTAITVVPNSPESLETVLGNAMKQGIIVVSHEAAGMKNTDIDIEAFQNSKYGADMMDSLAKCMSDTGGYVSMVGHLTAETHMQWAAGSLAQAKSKYPSITRLEDPIETDEDENVAYQKAKEVLAKFPNVKGFIGSASTDVLGIARAIEEAGKTGKVCDVGTGTPQASTKYLNDGSLQEIFFWDPAAAGEAQLTIAEMLAEGKKITPGTDLKIPGYTNLQLAPGYTNVFVGDAEKNATKATVGQWDF